jgi:hypothetical protein
VFQTLDEEERRRLEYLTTVVVMARERWAHSQRSKPLQLSLTLSPAYGIKLRAIQHVRNAGSQQAAVEHAIDVAYQLIAPLQPTHK